MVKKKKLSCRDSDIEMVPSSKLEGGRRAKGSETDEKVLREPETRLNLENMRKRVRKKDIKGVRKAAFKAQTKKHFSVKLSVNTAGNQANAPDGKKRIRHAVSGLALR